MIKPTDGPRVGAWRRAALGFGMPVMYHARRPVDLAAQAPELLGRATHAPLPELLAWADFVVAMLPLSDSTRGMVNAELFAAMKPGAIYNSNRFFLRALLQRMGCEVSDLGIVPDRREATLAALKTAADHHDLILTSGGVSVGEEDHIKPSVQALGSLDLWQIGMKPGKPFAYGTVRRDTPGAACHFIGLPGNPVSSFVTFLLLVRPFLLKLQGVAASRLQALPPATSLPAHFTVARADKRREFLRVRRNAAGGLDLFPNQSSGVLTSAVWGDGLVDNPAGTTIAHGDLVSYISFADLLA